MATGDTTGWQAKDSRTRIKRSARSYQESDAEAKLVGASRYPDFEFLDYDHHKLGDFVGYHLGVPYDWDILDPYLMRKEKET